MLPTELQFPSCIARPNTNTPASTTNTTNATAISTSIGIRRLYAQPNESARPTRQLHLPQTGQQAVSNSLARISQGLRHSCHVRGRRELRINLNGAGVIDNGALIFTLIIIDKAARVVGAGEVRVELYSSGQISNSRVELVQLAMNESAVEIGDGILRVSPDNERS